RRPAACRDETDHGRAGDAGKGGVDRSDPERDAVGRRDARLHPIRTPEVGRDGEATRSRGLAIAEGYAQFEALEPKCPAAQPLSPALGRDIGKDRVHREGATVPVDSEQFRFTSRISPPPCGRRMMRWSDRTGIISPWSLAGQG